MKRKQWIKCAYCRKLKEQATKGRVRLYCGEACKQAYYRFMKREREGPRVRTSKKRRREAKREKVCGMCGEVFRLGVRRRFYCSVRCYNRVETLLKKGMRRCPHCGKPFEGNRRIYCSAPCRKGAYEVRFEREHGLKRKARYANCPECGERFCREDGNGHLKKRYCSDTCRKRANDRTQYAQRMVRKRIKGVVNKSVLKKDVGVVD